MRQQGREVAAAAAAAETKAGNTFTLFETLEKTCLTLIRKRRQHTNALLAKISQERPITWPTLEFNMPLNESNIIPNKTENRKKENIINPVWLALWNELEFY